LAKECDLPLLGQVPIDPRIQEGGDTGRPIVDAAPDSKAAKAISQIAEQVMQRLAERFG
jgi:ATP-binding protein involved in chromosome partitioning